MPEDSDQRRLSPDSWKILGVLGTGVIVIIGVNQYQVDRGAELVLERAKSATVTQQALNDAFRPRDRAIKSLQADVTALREERAKVGQTLDNVDKTLTRIVDVSIQTQSRAASTEGQLKQLLNQTETNASLVSQLVDRHQAAYGSLSERMTRIEATTRVVTPSGTP